MAKEQTTYSIVYDDIDGNPIRLKIVDGETVDSTKLRKIGGIFIEDDRLSEEIEKKPLKDYKRPSTI